MFQIERIIMMNKIGLKIEMLVTVLLIACLCACGKNDVETSQPSEVSSLENAQTSVATSTDEEKVDTPEPEVQIKTEKVTRIKAKIVDGERKEYVYDEKGNLLQIGEIESFEYDEDGKKTRAMTNFIYIKTFAEQADSIEGLLAEWFGTDIDTAGVNLSENQKELLRNNIIDYVDYEYDARGNLIAERSYTVLYTLMFGDDLEYEEVECTNYEYDANDRLILETVGSRKYAFEYGDAGYNTKITVYNSDGSVKDEYENENAEGGDTSICKIIDGKVCICAYDEDGNLSMKLLEPEYYEDEGYMDVYSYEYEDGMLVSETMTRIYEYYDDDEEPEYVVTTTYEYEEAEIVIE